MYRTVDVAVAGGLRASQTPGLGGTVQLHAVTDPHAGVGGQGPADNGVVLPEALMLRQQLQPTL
jgi:hypothetical protein